MKTDFRRFVPIFTIEKWEDFENAFRGCGSIVFRGQGDSEWDLKTNYERTFVGGDVSRESSMLKRCIAEGHLFVENPPAEDDYVSWLAEMQHYGAPTRLLDVTRSKYIALFFALMGMEKGRDGAVWAFDVVRSDAVLYNSLKAQLPCAKVDNVGMGFGEGIMPYQDTGWKIANAAIACEPTGRITRICSDLQKIKRKLNDYYKKGMVVHLVPRQSNRRLLAQQGEFLFPLNIKRSFIQNLLGSIGGTDYSGKLDEFGNAEDRKRAETAVTSNVIKMVVPYAHKAEFAERLLEMNISYQTLFSDEMGFMKSLQFQCCKKRMGLKLKNGEKGEGLVLSCPEFLV